MVYDPDRYHHRSIRLKGYDYSRGGAYFITEATSIDPTISYVNIQSSPKTNGHIFGVRITTRF